MRLMKLLRSITKVQVGDFEKLAKEYARYQPTYAPVVAQALQRYVGASRSEFVVADIGSGTGIWSKVLLAEGISCICIEPDDAMREEGKRETQGYPVEWRKGTGSETTLADQSVDWITIASAVQWLDLEQAMLECKRILKPGGYLTILRHFLNPKEVDFLNKLQDVFRTHIPTWEKGEHPHHKLYRQLDKVLAASGLFENFVYMEGAYPLEITKNDYMTFLRALEAVQTELSSETFTALIRDIEMVLSDLDVLKIAYPTQAWTVCVKE